MTAPLPAIGARIFHGWYVVAGAFAVMLIGFGAAYSFGAFAGSLTHAFHATRGSVSLVFSLAGFLYFSLGIVSGPLADRLGARRLALAGMVLLGAGLALAGLAQTLTQVYVAYGLGVGFGVGLSYVPAIGAVQRWFVRRRGFASGIAVSGIGAGTLLVPLLANGLIALAGWRGAYMILGALALVLGVAFALLIENEPRRRGLAPDGDSLPPQAGALEVPGMSISEAIRTRRFVGLYAGCLICSFGLFVPFVHLVPYAVDHGTTPATAVALIAVVGIGSTVGRFALGSAADRMGRGPALIATFFGMAASFALWAISGDFVLLVAVAALYGTFYGGFVALLPALVMDDFGGRNVAGIIGVLYTSVACGTLVGPTAAGFAFDVSHSYTLTIVAGIVLMLSAAAVVASTSRAAPGIGVRSRLGSR